MQPRKSRNPQLDSILLSAEDDAEDLELADVIDASALQSMMEEFYKVSRIGTAILDRQGRIIAGA